MFIPFFHKVTNFSANHCKKLVIFMFFHTICSKSLKVKVQKINPCVKVFVYMYRASGKSFSKISLLVSEKSMHQVYKLDYWEIAFESRPTSI